MRVRGVKVRVRARGTPRQRSGYLGVALAGVVAPVYGERAERHLARARGRVEKEPKGTWQGIRQG